MGFPSWVFTADGTSEKAIERELDELIRKLTQDTLTQTDLVHRLDLWFTNGSEEPDMGQRLTWEKIRKAFPQRFVLLAACRIDRVGDIINVLEGEVLEATLDGKEIFHHYREHKKKEEVFFGYTGWEKLTIEERPFLGIRPAHG